LFSAVFASPIADTHHREKAANAHHLYKIQKAGRKREMRITYRRYAKQARKAERASPIAEAEDGGKAQERASR
jgi:hypothetical protein